jgi:hypothetical protein
MLRTSVACALLGLTLACATFTTDFDYDPEADFGALRTWSFGPWPERNPGTDVRLQSSLLHERIQSALVTGFAARGYPMSENADFWVVYHVGIEDRVDVTMAYRTFGGHHGHWAHGGVTVAEPIVTTWEAGTLVIDVLQPGDGRLLWRGVAEARLPRRSTREEREARVREVVAGLLAGFPPSD